MTGERNFVANGENSNLRVVRSLAWRQHEGCLNIIELGCDGLHLRGRKSGGVENHRQLVAAESAIGEDVDRDITPLHLFLLVRYPSCHTAIGRS